MAFRYVGRVGNQGCFDVDSLNEVKRIITVNPLLIAKGNLRVFCYPVKEIDLSRINFGEFYKEELNEET